MHRLVRDGLGGQQVAHPLRGSRVGGNRPRISCVGWFPDGGVVGEEDSAGVEVSEAVQPGLVDGEGLGQAVEGGLAGQVVGGELGREVVRLAA